MKQRRRFLSRGIALTAFGLGARGAFADSGTLYRFHQALERDPRLSVYAGIGGELAGAALVHGRMPPDLEGVFYRNGPGRFELGGERYHRWFDGDGFAQRWRIGGGEVAHRGRFVATKKFGDESEAGRFLYPAFGTHIERRAVKNNDGVNVANTNLLPFNGAVYALWEGGSAIELDPETLATRGVKIWRADLKAMPFSAHPKRDPDGGLWNFGNPPGGDRLFVYRLNAAGEVTRTAMVPALPMGGEMRAYREGRSATVQITLDYASGQAREARLFGVSEFPCVAPQAVSARHRKLAVLGAGGVGGDLILNTVNLIDTDSGKADSYAFGAGWQVEEHVLVPRRGARSETDGYLVGVAQDTRRGQTVLTVFDAHDIKAGPRALARLSYRAPVCFHGNFLAT